MSWTTFPTLTDGQVFTGAHTQLIRDNFAETAPAKATAAGQVWISTGPNAGAMRVPSFNTIATSQTTTSVASYTDLGTVGPAVTVTTGTQAIVSIAALMGSTTNVVAQMMSYAVSGATTIAAADANCVRQWSPIIGATSRASSVTLQNALTAGSNTFTCKYTTNSGGTSSFADRHLWVFPL